MTMLDEIYDIVLDTNSKIEPCDIKMLHEIFSNFIYWLYAFGTPSKLEAIFQRITNLTEVRILSIYRYFAIATLEIANEAHQKYYETGVQENVDLVNLSANML